MSKPQMPKLPKEAVKFAKSMGLDLSGLEPEAEDIWKMLDDMSTKDPMQYEEFVRQQFESAKDAGDKKEPAEAEKRSFRPAAGYCVETTTLSGDGLKIRDVGASSGKKLYINLCSSVVIEEPTDKSGKPIVGTRNVADDLSIPLIVGPVRGQEATSNENSKELYVDVVLHPRVIELANSEKYFKAQIVDLALDWVIKESKVECDRKWSHVTGTLYKGGRGDHRDTPVLFFVDANGAPVPMTPVDSIASAAPKSSVLSSTSSLLSQLNKEKSTESAHVAGNLDVLNTKPFTAGKNVTTPTGATAASKPTESKPAKPLIQEIGSPGPSLAVPLAEEIGNPSQISKPVSTEGITMKEAASRSRKPNDQSTSKPTSPPAAVPKPTPAPSTGTTSAGKPVARTAPPAPPGKAPAVVTPTAPTLKEPTKREFEGMEELLRSFDDEYSNVVGAGDNQTFLDTVSANDMIANLAKVLAGGSSGVPAIPSAIATPLNTTATATSTSTNGSTSTAPAKTKSHRTIESCVQVTNEAPTVVAIGVEASDASSADRFLTLTVSGLSSSLDTSTMELLVSTQEVIVKICSQYIPGPVAASPTAAFGAKLNGGAYQLLESTAVASFKKKKGTLSVKIAYRSVP